MILEANTMERIVSAILDFSEIEISVPHATKAAVLVPALKPINARLAPMSPSS